MEEPGSQEYPWVPRRATAPVRRTTKDKRRAKRRAENVSRRRNRRK